MGPIKDINNFPPEFRRIQENRELVGRVSKKSKTDGTDSVKAPKPNNAGAANVKISSDARSMFERMEGVDKYVQVLKESDSSEVKRVHEAIDNGKYDSPKSHQKIIEGIMADPEFKQILADRYAEVKKQRENPHQLSEEQIQSIREKIQSGYYEQPQVIEDIAGSILRPNA